ncbi:MAG: peptidase T [Chitinophagaceae bacterium]
MLTNYSFTASERFLRYVQVDTQSDPHSSTHPSTAKQKNLSSVLVDELLEMGVKDAHLDEYGYVYATIPATSDKNVPVICLCSHVDTAPDCSGTNVKPIVHTGYKGQDIVLPDDNTQVLRIEENPYLETQKGNDIITASGLTLLGSDDKAGVAEIMDLAKYLVSNPQVKHGVIKILFTTDEEIGKGTEKVDIKKLGAQFGYTLDGGGAGSLEDETFSADGVTVKIHGVSAHPGYAKDKLVNAMKIAGQILGALPKDRLAPEATEGRRGFIHPVHIEGNAESCVIEFIIRDFETPGLKKKADFLRTLVEETVRVFPRAGFEFHVSEQYRNMKEVLDLHPDVINNAKEAIIRTGLDVKMESIRGGTDGSRLSFMGLPSANLFTGMQAIHSKLEHISVQDMNKAVETLIHLVQVWEEKS